MTSEDLIIPGIKVLIAVTAAFIIVLLKKRWNQISTVDQRWLIWFAIAVCFFWFGHHLGYLDGQGETEMQILHTQGHLPTGYRNCFKAE